MEITDFYRGRSVLVTGATGFLGKTIVEKLLRCCPDVERIYIVVRAKNGQDPQLRAQKLLALPLFAGCPVAKVTAVAGDVLLADLGLAAEDRKTLEASVSVVLHSAAVVSFTEPLRVAVQYNVLAAQNVLLLARRFVNLAALVHVSTAYSHCQLPEVHEVLYPPPADVREMVRRAKQDDEPSLDRDTPKLLGGRPNTYTFTKALAESLWAEEAADLPVAIVRPSIVGWAWRDPCPGYVDNYNGIIGPYTFMTHGTLRSVNSDPAKVADVVPVDMVANTVLAVAWFTTKDRPVLRGGSATDRAAPCARGPPTVYNCVTGASNPVTWGKLLADWLAAVRADVPKCAVWYPGCSFTPSPVAHGLRVAALMIVPGFLHDLVAPLTGRRPNLLQTQRKARRLLDSLAFFSTREWCFADGNTRRVWSLMSPRDRLLFPMDVTAIDWEAYMSTAAAGSKRFLLREDGFSGQRIGLYLVHRLTQLALLSVLFSLLGWLLRPFLVKLWPSCYIRYIRFALSKW